VAFGKPAFSQLKALLPERERRFRFPYGSYHDEAELVILAPPSWDGQVPPSVKLIALKGNWQAGSEVPDSSLGKQMLRAAEKASGLKLTFSKTWSPDEKGNVVRAVSLAKGCVGQVHYLLPAVAEA
jgi:hypothetical protein